MPLSFEGAMSTTPVIGRTTRRRETVQLRLADHASTRGHDPAVVIGGRVVSFGELHLRVSRLASVLRSPAFGASTVEVRCCPERFDDRLVGHLACRAAGVARIVHRTPGAAFSTDCDGVLACGCEPPRRPGSPNRSWMLGDVPEVRWWSLVERRAQPLPLEDYARSDDEVDSGPGARGHHPGDLQLGLSACAAGLVQRISPAAPGR